jgi:hypothetical protein
MPLGRVIPSDSNFDSVTVTMQHNATGCLTPVHIRSFRSRLHINVVFVENLYTLIDRLGVQMELVLAGYGLGRFALSSFSALPLLREKGCLTASSDKFYPADPTDIVHDVLPSEDSFNHPSAKSPKVSL